METWKASREIREAMNYWGLVDWTFQWDNSKGRFGCCKHSQQIITLSKNLVALNSAEEVRDTMLHEIAHALVGPRHGHDEVWKRKCREIGAKPVRCYDGTVAQPKKKWKLRCLGCGKTYLRHKRNRAIAQGLRRCVCGGRFQYSFNNDQVKVTRKERDEEREVRNEKPQGERPRIGTPAKRC